jgi:hypothetical protein
MKTDQFGREVVPCELCGTDTPMTGTMHCDGCHELETRIHMDPELARKILKELENENG